MFDPIDLPTVWAGLLAFTVLVYVLLDGFDLGIGILYPFLKKGPERDTAMNTVAPVWDGNETWLVLGGGGLMAAFPLAYGVVMSALYMPILAMLIGLVFRGVSFEFRWRDPGHEKIWDLCFFGGSVIATFSKASFWVPLFRVSMSRAGIMPAAGLTGLRRSACLPAHHWWLVMRFWGPCG